VTSDSSCPATWTSSGRRLRSRRHVLEALGHQCRSCATRCAAGRCFPTRATKKGRRADAALGDAHADLEQVLMLSASCGGYLAARSAGCAGARVLRLARRARAGALSAAGRRALRVSRVLRLAAGDGHGGERRVRCSGASRASSCCRRRAARRVLWLRRELRDQVSPSSRADGEDRLDCLMHQGAGRSTASYPRTSRACCICAGSRPRACACCTSRSSLEEAL
jgi:hypothetical protein